MHALFPICIYRSVIFVVIVFFSKPFDSLFISLNFCDCFAHAENFLCIGMFQHNIIAEEEWTWERERENGNWYENNTEIREKKVDCTNNGMLYTLLIHIYTHDMLISMHANPKTYLILEIDWVLL